MNAARPAGRQVGSERCMESIPVEEQEAVPGRQDRRLRPAGRRKPARSVLTDSPLSGANAAMYLSHRTVATHLYQIFPKLGVTSRAALRDALSSNEGRDEAGP